MHYNANSGCNRWCKGLIFICGWYPLVQCGLSFHQNSLTTVITRREEAEASPSIGNTLWHVSTMFTHSAITLRRKWTDLDEIWGTPSILFGAGPGRFWARSAQKWERETLRKFCFFLSGKQCTTLPISSKPIFTKFAHKTCFWEAMNPFGIIFLKICPQRVFFPKNRDHCQWFPTSSCDFSEVITNLGKWWQVGVPVECWFSIYTVGMNSKWFPWPVTRVQKCTFQSPVSAEFTYLKCLVRRYAIPFQSLVCF